MEQWRWWWRQRAHGSEGGDGDAGAGPRPAPRTVGAVLGVGEKGESALPPSVPRPCLDRRRTPPPPPPVRPPRLSAWARAPLLAFGASSLLPALLPLPPWAHPPPSPAPPRAAAASRGLRWAAGGGSWGGCAPPRAAPPHVTAAGRAPRLLYAGPSWGLATHAGSHVLDPPHLEGGGGKEVGGGGGARPPTGLLSSLAGGCVGCVGGVRWGVRPTAPPPPPSCSLGVCGLAARTPVRGGGWTRAGARRGE
ncbi:hypothetical protein I4F81_004815 [Pyropia yezoensis]|uniref:Uncharacterized protein n=1 Tax=Pyropia yezoensis TaxID=2788 RepID=A0ACC3BX22_PYRYE|nr:hypothetical protein I4F81_004815 [Neopyropia yezoensis]